MSMIRASFVAGLILAGLVPGLHALGQSDATPPVLLDFSFSPDAIDTTSSPVSVLVIFQVTDDLSGVEWAKAEFMNRGSATAPRRNCTSLTPQSGTPLDGIYGCTIEFPRFAEAGLWTATVELRDVDDNGAMYSTATLASMGLPAELIVTSQSDTTAPVLDDFTFSPSAIDTTNGGATVLARFDVNDDLSGVAWAKVEFRSPGTPPLLRGCTSFASVPDDVPASNVSLICDVYFPRFSEAGTWSVFDVVLSDAAGNIGGYDDAALAALGFPTELTVLSQSDLTPPTLVGFSFSPDTVDTTAGPDTVAITMQATDDLSGVDAATATFEGPGSPPQEVECASSSPSGGTPLDGTYECAIEVPEFSAEGSWRAAVEIRDSIGNARTVSSDALEQGGLPAYLSVGFVPGDPRASISAPPHGRRVRGNSVTIAARLSDGSLADLSPSLGVRFEYRQLPFGTFAQIPPGDAGHPNPDITLPFFIHWDISSTPEGDYEVRAVAHRFDGTPDLTPPVVTVTADEGGTHDIDENVDGGLQENETSVGQLVDNDVVSGSRASTSALAELRIPAGALADLTDTAVLHYPDPAAEETKLEQLEQSTGIFVHTALQSGQTALGNGLAANLSISYPDVDQDGVVDGTSIREEDLELRRYDPPSGSYVIAAPWVVLTEHNMVHAAPTSLGRFALVGPLLPRIGFATDRSTLSWESVTGAESYRVYRGDLGDLVDADADGLPDGGYGECRNHLDPEPIDTTFVDSDIPGAPGDGFLYLVSVVSPQGERGLGNTSAGLRRYVVLPCP